MKVRRPRSAFLAFSGACLLLAGAGTLALTAPSGAPAAPAAAPAVTNDPVHSSNVFRIKHAGVANFYGRFNKVSGGFTFDPKALETSSIEATMDTASVDTNNSKRDDHLKSDSFFDAEKYPQITFKSKSIKKAGEKFDVAGDLTMRGVTKPVTAKVEYFGEKDGGSMLGFRAGLEAQFTVKRSEFGVSYGLDGGMLGDEVLLIVSLEGVKK